MVYFKACFLFRGSFWILYKVNLICIKTRNANFVWYIEKEAELPSRFYFPGFKRLVVVKTDASAIDVETLLAQRGEHGKDHLIKFSSSTINAFQKTYYARERM